MPNALWENEPMAPEDGLELNELVREQLQIQTARVQEARLAAARMQHGIFVEELRRMRETRQQLLQGVARTEATTPEEVGETPDQRIQRGEIETEVGGAIRRVEAMLVRIAGEITQPEIQRANPQL